MSSSPVLPDHYHSKSLTKVIHSLFLIETQDSSNTQKLMSTLTRYMSPITL